ncbi:family ABC-F type ribosomal protection [Chlorella sorokiniana]|uniref:Family ABC-F type ribosomal protection n=1 Tax=Chlorella sorokiniana TaxID=3076 RepID=A0A2P6TFG3_CHLSO|nr:family ABC-F type ribosomal protection [Chlorella sorokiniana]|eukprot:PRW32839.1 family ABC-F type ribosomal protection [Chlorella sorokiniana]
MGSLAPSWDTGLPGRAPKGFEDFKEPVSPRAHCRGGPFSGSPQASGDLDKPGSPPKLARVSAPPAMHGAAAVQRYLSRSSGSVPPSPRVSTPHGSGTPKHMMLKVGDEEMNHQPIDAKERWCARVESSRLNERPDERDEESWRHGGFKLLDPSHSMHIAAASAAAAVAAVDGAPVTPPEGSLPSPRPRVTAARIIPEEAGESLDSAGL